MSALQQQQKKKGGEGWEILFPLEDTSFDV